MAKLERWQRNTGNRFARRSKEYNKKLEAKYIYDNEQLAKLDKLNKELKKIAPRLDIADK